MAPRLADRKRKASKAIAASEDEDSDCIAVASPRPKVALRRKETTRQSLLRPPFTEVEHNIIRRPLKCVRIPVSPTQQATHTKAASARPAKRAKPSKEADGVSQRSILSFWGHGASTGKDNTSAGLNQSPHVADSASSGPSPPAGRRESSPLLVSDVVVEDRHDSAASSTQPEQKSTSLSAPGVARQQGRAYGTSTSSARPRRSVGAKSYVADEEDVVSSEDEGPRLPKRLLNARRKTMLEDSDFAEEDASSSAEEVEEVEDSPEESSNDGEVDDEELEDVKKPLRTQSNTRNAPQGTSATKRPEPSALAKLGKKKASSDMKSLINRAKGQGVGMDLKAPPMSNIDDIFMDLTKKALDLGLQKPIQHLGSRPLRVGTMCSGTESPLLSLQMITDALKMLRKPHFGLDHAFSAEIVFYKQAYIERNFAPAKLFRDITEFHKSFEMEEPMAETAYGSMESIPTDLDILIAGTSCVDYSNLNNRKKRLGDGGESGDTFLGALSYCKATRPAIILFENVGSAEWENMLEYYRDIDYECAGVFVDTKDYYLPQTRQRGYMVCFDRRKSNKSISGFGAKWQSLIEQFKRPASSPASSFLLPGDRLSNRQPTRDDEVARVVGWDKSEIRHLQYRHDLGLGSDRPFTRWQESGSIDPPENGSAAWFRKLVEREKDTIDCAHIRASLPKFGACDARFKTKLWDLSQNIDRIQEKTHFGILGCITPSGKPYISDAARPLAPEEALVLQGIPLSKISMTTESPKEVFDLAGNAMSTPVVGAATISAIMVAYELLKPGDDSLPEDTAPEPARLAGRTQTIQYRDEAGSLDMRQLIDRAAQSVRKCPCETGHKLCEKPLQQCLDCGHTTCVSCGGNPTHNYRQIVGLDQSRLSPSAFIKDLKAELPLRLVFEGQKDLSAIATSSKARSPSIQAYLQASTAAIAETFTFQSIRRTHCWTVNYSGQSGRLELVIDRHDAEWRLFANPAKELAGDDWLRSCLQQPVAKALVTESLLEPQWHWRLPAERTLSVQLDARQADTPAWRARNGMPAFQQDEQPMHMDIRALGDAPDSLESLLSGTYRYFPKCGKACDSLYRKVDDDPTERPLFLFLDPTRTGSPQDDEFVFSHNIARLEYSEVRSVIARVKAPWRPWPEYNPGKDLQRIKTGPAKVVVDAQWVDATAQMNLKPKPTELEVRKSTIPEEVLRTAVCTHAQQLVACELPAQIPILDMVGSDIDQAGSAKFMSANAWILEAMSRCLPEGEWQKLSDAGVHERCQNCSPAKPEQRWKLGGEKRDLQPYEDPKSASVYHRAIRSRPSLMRIHGKAQTDGPSSVGLDINITSMAHRALARLPSTTGKVEVKWRLDTDSQMPSSISMPTFRLSPTKGVEPFNGDLKMSVELFPTQRLALAWMRRQESGRDFLIEEAEEATLPGSGWRAEVRATVPMTVRGGICADHPGFGKTITSLALIQAQHLESKPASIKAELQSRQEGSAAGLLPSCATLIICPHTLLRQWKDEAVEKLRSSDGIVMIARVDDLDKHTVSDFQNAKIILFSRSLLGGDAYVERLAAFAGAPGPATNSGRVFSQWLRFVKNQIPEHLTLLQSSVSELKNHAKNKYKRLLESDEFKATVPSQRLRGQAYVAGKGSKKGQSQRLHAAAPSLNTDKILKPLLEMFFFNRMIVDEFHQNDARENAAILSLQADKRWGLSGTPAMSDFYDIAQLAGLLAVPARIGSDARGLMKARNIERVRREMTEFERFDAMRETPSSSMNARISETHQMFLDTFVRRNVMDFGALDVQDTLKPVVLSLDHRAMYTELSEHLNSTDMKIKRGKKTQATDREERLYHAVATSMSAEEALSKTAAYLERDVDGSRADGSGLTSAIATREDEAEDIKRSIHSALADALASEPEPIANWVANMIQGRGIKDDETVAAMEEIVAAPRNGTVGKLKTSAAKAKAKSKRKTSDEDDEDMEDAGEAEPVKAAASKTTLTSAVNRLTSRLVVAHRSLRFLRNVQTLQKRAKQSSSYMEQCEDVHCKSSLRPEDDIAISAVCGHVICNDCYARLNELNGSQCPAAGCGCSMQSYHLLWKSKMGDLKQTSLAPFGAKLEASMDLLQDIQAKKDKAILFVQYQEQLEEAECALADREIPATVVKATQKGANQISDFRKNKDTVIVLNASDETAAGSNLQDANHVIFLSPLLRDSQYEYDATMAQAIGRVRRHNQKKKIYVHRIVALDTIDVDILEHRERRTDALAEPGAPPIAPPPVVKMLDMHEEPERERTQLVKENGRFSLRPQSWLVRCGADDHPAKDDMVKGKSRVGGWENFSSLLKFSGAYTEDDD